MTVIKSYTNIPQSKKLAEILPIESADMVYIKHSTSSNPDWRFDDDMPPMILRKTSIKDMTVEVLPCWSLAALLGVLPSATLDSSDDHHYRVHCNERFTDWYDNPIDCCVAMINRLHEQMIYDFNNR